MTTAILIEPIYRHVEHAGGRIGTCDVDVTDASQMARVFMTMMPLK
jgi:hypothetical protein